MSIIIDQKTRVVIQGITGNVGQGFVKKMIEDGTNIVCGVTPGKGGERVYGVPVFNTVEEAVCYGNPNISLVVVPAQYLKDAVFEVLYNDIKKLVIYTENVPLHDEIELVYYAKTKNAFMLGPNSPGLASPGMANVSDFNSKYLKKGRVGIVSKSGTLTYEIIEGLKQIGLGVSTFVCIGGDRVSGVDYVDILPLFEEDPETDFIVMIGEIGGFAELRAIPIIKKMKKRVFAYIAGQFIPKGKTMGHAGAIISESGDDSAQNKIQKLNEAGVITGDTIINLFPMISKYLKNA
jgi:succinyl-CoA synthetase alpha subunit